MHARPMMTAVLLARFHACLQLCLLLGGELLEERVVRASAQQRQISAGARCALRELLQPGLVELTRQGDLLQGVAGLLRVAGLCPHLGGLSMQDRKHPIALCLAQVQPAQQSRSGQHQPIMAVLGAASVMPGVACMRGVVWLTGVMTAAVRRPVGHGLPGG